MQDLFISLLRLLECKGAIAEAFMYSGGDFSKITAKTKDGTYSITVSKEKETDGNS